MDDESCRWSCLKEKVQLGSTFGVVADNQDLLALTGGAGCFELDGEHLWGEPTAIYASDESIVAGIQANVRLRKRPAVRPCIGAMTRPSVDEVVPHLVPSNDVATINANLSSCR